MGARRRPRAGEGSRWKTLTVRSPPPEDDLRTPLVGSAIPAALTSLIGRTRDVDVVSDALGRCPLLTVTGPGGVGKTSLATEVARRQLPRRPDGVWLVDLAAGPRTPDVATETAR